MPGTAVGWVRKWGVRHVMKVPLSLSAAEPERAALERALGAQYEIVRLLGRGGMGAVYLARDRELERAVAIKLLPPDLGVDVESRERFRREARTAAKLTHPNIVPLYSVGEAEGMLYFVMGYVRGISLGERMAREGRLSAEDVRSILAQLADALDYAHRQGVVHRDIKPDNVLLDDESGRPMLTDFGVAKARLSGATLTEVGTVLGTPHYMSPEQASGERDVDGRSDLYSLGIMGYAMLSGRLPFDGNSVRDIIVQHLAKVPPPLRSVASDVPDDLELVITRALAKNADDRWADGRTMAQAVGDAGTDESEHSADSITGSGMTIAIVWLGAASLALFARTTIFFSRPVHPGNSVPPWWLLPLILAAVPVVPIGVIALLQRNRGERWTDIIRKVMRQPKAWVFWWPRRWRRTGDVWDRLPKPIRLGRALFALALPLFFGTIACMLISMDHYANEVLPPWWMDRILFTMLAAGCALCIGGALTAKLWLRKTSLTNHEHDMVMLTPTTRLDFWRKRKYAAILLPASTHANATAIDEALDARGYVRAIAERAADLPVAVRDLGSEAVDASRQILTALEQLDAEIAMLVRDANPTELAQVEQKLAAMGSDDDDSENRRALRLMLVSQRDLLHRLNEQLAETSRRRDHLLDMLRSLWLQVANLRAMVAHDARGSAENTGRIRAVAAEIATFQEVYGRSTLPGSS